jgi:hypothetical protein
VSIARLLVLQLFAVAKRVRLGASRAALRARVTAQHGADHVAILAGVAIAKTVLLPDARIGRLQRVADRQLQERYL